MLVVFHVGAGSAPEESLTPGPQPPAARRLADAAHALGAASVAMSMVAEGIAPGNYWLGVLVCRVPAEADTAWLSPG